MTTQKHSESIETAFAHLSGVAFENARNQALKSGQGVLQVEGDALYRVYLDGRKEFIKHVSPSVSVDSSQPIYLK